MQAQSLSSPPRTNSSSRARWNRTSVTTTTAKTARPRSPLGVRQADREESFKPYGVTVAVWQRRVTQAREFQENFALYNAPAGTMQRMAVYFYLDSAKAEATREAVMAFTHDDVYKPMPGYQVMVSHFHFHLNEELTDAGTLDHQPSWIPTFKALGINIAALCDFHADSHPTDTGKVRLEEQRVYFEGSARFSDRDFLIIPGEEPDSAFGGHFFFLFPMPVYFTHAPLLRPGHARGAALFGRYRDVWQGVSHVVAGGGVAAAER